MIEENSPAVVRQRFALCAEAKENASVTMTLALWCLETIRLEWVRIVASARVLRCPFLPELLHRW